MTRASHAHSDSRVVDSARHPVARRIADVLRTKSARPKVCIIDDFENIEQAVRGGVELDSLYATASAQGSMLRELHGVGSDVPRYVLDDGVAANLFGGQKRSRMFALARAPKPAGLRDLLRASGDILVLDGVRMLGNVGAITRTARAFGAAGVVVLESGLSTALDRRLIRASRGLVFTIPVVLATRERFIHFNEQERLSLAQFCADAPDSLHDIGRVRERLALVLGSERDGVSEEIGSLTTRRYAIPMEPGVESLNVSVAAGIALHARSASRS
ncbi:MAG TPA: NshR/TsnR family 23S rRNA methyltransferase [Candidatus Agrococcus pullicola]|uniref:NshR/TsnR family 23S rRNA methyltransferase n=1 Tax=Candidatus Agrococcus pullicola TaxID=2838429 RepID=A0A9D1YT60_9MICO|nr:NshR/TsnR family 23S rRNA methyltransferase [Candidatus Agrococcus pullicola]